MAQPGTMAHIPSAVPAAAPQSPPAIAAPQASQAPNLAPATAQAEASSPSIWQKIVNDYDNKRAKIDAFAAQRQAANPLLQASKSANTAAYYGGREFSAPQEVTSEVNKTPWYVVGGGAQKEASTPVAPTATTTTPVAPTPGTTPPASSAVQKVSPEQIQQSTVQASSNPLSSLTSINMKAN